MIVFELICAEHHRFEGWFAAAEDFERQKSQGQLSCPACCNGNIEKLLIAKIRKQGAEAHSQSEKPAVSEPNQEKIMQALIDHILMHTEDVGNAFPEEARKIHYKEVPLRNIRGIASPLQTAELIDEGIAVVPLPIPRRSDWQ